MAIPLTGPLRDAYEAGYRDGEASMQADYNIAFERAGAWLPDDVAPESPSELAAYVRRLQAARDHTHGV